MFDYERYGAFKSGATASQPGRLKNLARRLGFRNRYLRFLRNASRQDPLLEIGCGDGSFLRELLDAGFNNVLGLEPSPTYSPVVDPRLIARTFADQYLETAASASIGTAVALDVFEHVPADSLRTLLVMLEDRLLPGGIVLIRVPNMATGLGQFTYFGDLSHTTALNEMSLRQLAFDTAFSTIRFYPEPFAYPRTFASALGIGLWPLYRLGLSAILAGFGIRAQVLTPNIICLLTKRSEPNDGARLEHAARPESLEASR